MKNLNKLLLIVVLSIVSLSISNAQCPTSFNITDYGNGIFAFIPDSATSGINYYWDFGDGNNSTQQYVNQYQYGAPGNYNVCLTVDSCPTVCIAVVYTTSTPCNFTAGFTYTDNGGGNFSFTNTSTGSGLSYFWDFGDGNTSTTINPNHTYTSNGLFVVDLIITDSNNLCLDYFYTTVQVTGVSSPIPCNSSFVIIPDSASQQGPGSGTVVVFNTSSGSNLTYFWDFGDGNTSTQQYPNYTYATNGPFYLCLTVDDGNGCSSTYCDSINSAGFVYKQNGFTINIISPAATAIKENVEQISALNIYPNPFKDNLSIDFNLNEQAQVEIFVSDLLGNTIDQISTEGLTVGNNHLIWNAKKLSNGIYLLHIKTNNSMQVKKLVLNR